MARTDCCSFSDCRTYVPRVSISQSDNRDTVSVCDTQPLRARAHRCIVCLHTNLTHDPSSPFTGHALHIIVVSPPTCNVSVLRTALLTIALCMQRRPVCDAVTTHTLLTSNLGCYIGPRLGSRVPPVFLTVGCDNASLFSLAVQSPQWAERGLAYRLPDAKRVDAVGAYWTAAVLRSAANAVRPE